MSKKAKLAEILYDLPTNKISTEDIRWIMSHLPEDNNERGKEAVKPQGVIAFNHNTEDLREMVGINNKEILQLLHKFEGCFESKDKAARKSYVLEKFYPLLNDKEKVFLIAYGIPRFQHEALEVAVTEGDEDAINAAMGPEAAEIPLEEKRQLLAKMLELKKLLSSGDGLGGLLGGLLGGAK